MDLKIPFNSEAELDLELEKALGRVSASTVDGIIPKMKSSNLSSLTPHNTASLPKCHCGLHDAKVDIDSMPLTELVQPKVFTNG